MSTSESSDSTRANQLRLWPGVAAVAVQWSIRFGLPAIAPDATIYAILGGLLCGLAVLVWWMFFSRAPWLERLGAVGLIIAALAVTPVILDRSIATGMMGMMFPMHVVPTVSLGLVAGAAAGRRLAKGPRRAVLATSILISAGIWALLRTEGIDGAGRSKLAWRWTASPEEQLLKQNSEVEPGPPPAPSLQQAPKLPPAQPAAARPEVRLAVRPPAVAEVPRAADWPGFRGPRRDGVIRDVRIKIDWAASPPVELWRRPVGPGWSSAAVHGGLIYTQEQRGDSEVVSCYQLATGEPVWTHSDAARFWESNAGPGPRATPTVHEGRVYSFGATGILNALDAGKGSLLWARNAASDTGAKLPGWGFTSSPIVFRDLVIVAASGQLAAYDRTTGEPRWKAQEAGSSYSSPHLSTIGGVEQILFLNNSGIIGLAPDNGSVLWKHSWPGSPILQPAPIAGGVLIATNDMAGGTGTRRLAVAQGENGWTADEVWTSRGLKPYFNDFVVHKGHAFGFDGSILSCIDLQNGKRVWKGGRYGHGQLLLLADQDALLVLSEEGELALVSATPGQFSELARFRAIEGKTWNHPALSGDILIVRNGQEIVAFRMPLAGD